jgi:hypothetical protein
MTEPTFSYGGIGPAEDPADHERAYIRSAVVDRWLPKIADEVLASPEIARVVAQAGVDPATLRAMVLNRREEVLALADVSLDRVVDAEPASGVASHRRVRGAGMIVMGGVLVVVPPLILVGLWTDLAWWVVVLSVIGVAVAVFTGAVFFRGGLGTYRDAMRGSSVSAETALASWWQVCRDEGVLPLVRRIVDEHLSPVARTVLGVTTEDAPGLAGRQ